MAGIRKTSAWIVCWLVSVSVFQPAISYAQCVPWVAGAPIGNLGWPNADGVIHLKICNQGGLSQNAEQALASSLALLNSYASETKTHWDQGCDNADFAIGISGSGAAGAWDGCGQYNGYNNISITQDVNTNLSLGGLEWLITHELIHVYGVDDDNSGATTIMNQVTLTDTTKSCSQHIDNPQLAPPTMSLQFSDVQKAKDCVGQARDGTDFVGGGTNQEERPIDGGPGYCTIIWQIDYTWRCNSSGCWMTFYHQDIAWTDCPPYMLE